MVDARIRGYIVNALQASPDLPFDKEKLRELVPLSDWNWKHHRKWVEEVCA
jgi:hypothetical protein